MEQQADGSLLHGATVATVGLKVLAQSIVVDECRPRWRPGGPRASAGAVSAEYREAKGRRRGGPDAFDRSYYVESGASRLSDVPLHVAEVL